jgi:nitrogen regulatory protein P-II 1
MSEHNELIVLTDLMLVTVVVQRGYGDLVAQVALDAGVQGVTVFHAHGTGDPQKYLGLLSLTVNTEKEIVYIVVPAEQADRLFERVFVSAKMDTPGMGILWLTRLEKMATYVPHEIAARFGVHAAERRE